MAAENSSMRWHRPQAPPQSPGFLRHDRRRLHRQQLPRGSTVQDAAGLWKSEESSATIRRSEFGRRGASACLPVQRVHGPLPWPVAVLLFSSRPQTRSAKCAPDQHIPDSPHHAAIKKSRADHYIPRQSLDLHFGASSGPRAVRKTPAQNCSAPLPRIRGRSLYSKVNASSI